MENPLKTIKLSDFGNHMRLNTVMQLKVLNDIMKKQVGYLYGKQRYGFRRSGR